MAASGIRSMDLPFQTGLSQKDDPVWLAPGSASQAVNLIKKKQGSFGKRPGVSALTTVGRFAATGTAGGSIATLASGKRLGTYKGTLNIIGPDTSWTDAIWTYDDTNALPIIKDRVPEIFVQPYDTLGGAGALTSKVDICVCNGYEVLVWAEPFSTITGNYVLKYSVRDATTKAIVVTATRVDAAQNGSSDSYDLPVVFAVGTNVIIVFTESANGKMYATKLDCTQPTTPITALVAINVNPNDANTTPALSLSKCCTFDACPVIGDPTQFVTVYGRNNVAGAPSAVSIQQIAVSNFAVTAFANIHTNDALWSGEKAAFFAMAVRADATNNEVAIAYSYSGAGSTARLNVQTVQYSGSFGTVIGTAINLLGAPGPASPTVDLPCQPIAIERVGTVNTHASTYKVMGSPYQGSMVASNNNTTLSLAAYIIEYLAYPAAGTMTIHSNMPRATFGVSLASRILALNGIAYVMAFCPSNTQGSFFVLADDSWSDVQTANTTIDGATSYFPMRLVGTLLARANNAIATNGLVNPFVAILPCHWAQNPNGQGGNVYHMAATVSRSSSTSQPAIFPIDFASTLGNQCSELGDNMLLAGACPSGFDGAQCFELAFPYYPSIQSLTAAAGGVLSAGTYLYLATYEWRDTRGQVHRSGRSVPQSVTVTANQKVTVVVTVMGFSAKTKAPTAALSGAGNGPQNSLPRRGDVQIRLWRTTAGGTTYYSINGSDGNPEIVNGTGSWTLSFVDASISDAQIQAHAKVYGDGSDGTSSGNILDNYCPPSFQCATIHKRRMWGASGIQVWYTKALTSGEGVGFNELDAFTWPDGPGNITALASLDEKLILFKADRIAAMYGEGPADNGLNNDLTPPQRIATDVGCIDWRSVVATDKGIYFQSAAGRRLLTRGLEVTPIPVVEDADAAFPVVTSAVIHPSQGQVVFTQTADDMSTPRVGVSVGDDYVLGSWTLRQFAQANAPQRGMVSAAVANVPLVVGGQTTLAPTYHSLREDGVVLREKATSAAGAYADGNSPGLNFVGSTWTSPWIKSDGILGWSQWQMLRFLLQLNDPCQLTVTLAYDYDPSTAEPHVYSYAQLLGMVRGGGSTGLAYLECQPNNQRANVMQVTIADALDPVTRFTSGQGVSLLGARVDYGFEPGGTRVAPAQRG